jgi:hypothetical protein
VERATRFELATFSLATRECSNASCQIQFTIIWRARNFISTAELAFESESASSVLKCIQVCWADFLSAVPRQSPKFCAHFRIAELAALTWSRQMNKV